MHYVYVLQSSKDNRHYIGNIGNTGNLKKRLDEHNRNVMRSTKHRGPWQIIHREEFEDKTEALRREHYIKSLKGGNAFKKLLKNVVPIV